MLKHWDGIAGALIAGKLRDRCASFVLLQNPDDLSPVKHLRIISMIFLMDQSLLQKGFFQRGKVNPFGAYNSNRMASGRADAAQSEPNISRV